MLNRKFSRRGKYALAVAVSSVLLPAGAKGDTYYFQHAGGGDFNSALDPYFSWFDSTTSTFVNLPTIGSTANVLLSGTNGIGGASINMNAVYTGNGLSFLDLASAISSLSPRRAA